MRPAYAKTFLGQYVLPTSGRIRDYYHGLLGEYRFGIAQSRHKSRYERWLGGILSASRVLDVTDETASHYAVIRMELKRAGTPIPSNDIWIAALSRQHALPVLSRDEHLDLIKGLRRQAW